MADSSILIKVFNYINNCWVWYSVTGTFDSDST